jgi:hypothetical protein
VTRRTLPILVVLALSLVWSAPALAGLDPYQQIVLAYLKTGKLDACKYSQALLKKAKDVTPVDQNQYSASFIAALDDAIAKRAQGGCNKTKTPAATQSQSTPTPTAPTGQTPPPATSGKRSGTTAAPTTGAPTTQPAQQQAPPTPTSEPAPAPYIAASHEIALASKTTAAATDAPFPMLALAILCALMALGLLSVALVRWFAWEPAWTARMRHATGEAGWRASSAWSDFADFVRLGR